MFLWLNPFGHGRGVLCSAHGSKFDKGTQTQLLGALYQVKLLAIEVKKIKHAQTSLKLIQEANVCDLCENGQKKRMSIGKQKNDIMQDQITPLRQID